MENSICFIKLLKNLLNFKLFFDKSMLGYLAFLIVMPVLSQMFKYNAWSDGLLQNNCRWSTTKHTQMIDYNEFCRWSTTINCADDQLQWTVQMIDYSELCRRSTTMNCADDRLQLIVQTIFYNELFRRSTTLNCADDRLQWIVLMIDYNELCRWSTTMNCTDDRLQLIVQMIHYTMNSGGVNGQSQPYLYQQKKASRKKVSAENKQSICHFLEIATGEQKGSVIYTHTPHIGTHHLHMNQNHRHLTI
jgi:hypothetical protein